LPSSGAEIHQTQSSGSVFVDYFGMGISEEKNLKEKKNSVKRVLGPQSRCKNIHRLRTGASSRRAVKR